MPLHVEVLTRHLHFFAIGQGSRNQARQQARQESVFGNVDHRRLIQYRDKGAAIVAQPLGLDGQNSCAFILGQQWKCLTVFEVEVNVVWKHAFDEVAFALHVVQDAGQVGQVLRAQAGLLQELVHLWVLL